MDILRTTGLTSREFDAVKGILILCIVAGHDQILTHRAPGLFHFLYSFHVLGFLFLPFLMPARPLTRAFAADRAVRYLVPYLVVYVVAALGFAALFVYPERVQNVEPSEWPGLALTGLFVGTAHAIKRGCGFQAYWFLPALFALTLARSALASVARNPRAIPAVAACAVAGHLIVGALPREVRYYLVFGSGVVAYVAILGWLGSDIWQRWMRHARWLVLPAAFLFGVGSLLSRSFPLFNLGVLTVPSIVEPGRLLIQDVVGVTAFLTICGSAFILARIPGLATLGRSSLLVYLIHPFLLTGMRLAVARLPRLEDLPAPLLTLGFGSLALALAGSLGVALLVQQVDPVRRLVAPRSVDDWPLTAAARRPSGSLPS